MKYCDKCHVNISGDKKNCPLCQQPVFSIDENVEEVFPEIPTVYRQYHLFFRILIFISAVIGIVSVLINYTLYPHKGAWSIFILAGIGCLWFNIAFAVRKRTNILKNIMYQVVAISISSVFWDIIIGWHRWSIDFVIPIVIAVSMITMAIVAKVMKQYIDDQIIYFCINSLFGIIPIIFVIAGNPNIVYPSVICVAISITTFVGMLVFQGDILKEELKKRLHI